LKDHSDIPQELFEAIERYIQGTMPPKELKDFNEYLNIDADFRLQVEEIKTLLLGIETQALKEQLDAFHEEIPGGGHLKNPSKKAQYLFISKIAAAAAIIIAIGSIWFFSSSPNQKLYAKYFKPDPGLPTTMGNNANFEFYDAMVNYKHGDYALAIKKWEKLNAIKPDNDTIAYFLGVAHLANKNEDRAIPFFEKVILNPDFVFQNDAYFYLGLSYLKNGNYKAAKKNFTLSKLETSKELLKQLD
jgi:tetratricopeptide (TPR) repeat protein